ncbi:MAG: M28 family peptidase [Candidatus Sericytochromatia bacterium]|nr:M28 family peptidase [Candidatus Sericytochromatia bacterium]
MRYLTLFTAFSLLLTAPVAANPHTHAQANPHPAPTAETSPAHEPLLLKNARQLVFSGKRSGEGYFSADGKKLIFQSERESDNPFFQMYLLDFESGETTRVSPGWGKTTCGWIHPNGKQVMFSSTQDDPEAKQKQKSELDFRASGKSRRYSWDYDPQYEIYQADISGGKYVNLTRSLGYDAEGAYSPDGKEIVFASNRSAYQGKLSDADRQRLEQDPASFMDLYIMKSDGSNVRRLTTSPGYDGGPFFSADGKKIIWRRFSQHGDSAEIFSINRDGSGEKQLTQMGVLSWAPFYHPSGDYLIFATNKQGFANFELYLVDAAGQKEPVRVTQTEGFDGLPVFSPDGKRLVWTSGRTANGQSQLFMADWNDTEARRLLKLAPAGSVARDPGKGSSSEAGDPFATTAALSADDLKKRIYHLAAPATAGRMTGSPGEALAADYAAEVFKRLGLVPAGDKGTWFQSFEFTAGVSLGDKNQMQTPGLKTPVLNQDWRPMPFSQSGNLSSAAVAFAGYGLVVPESPGQPGYDSYVHLDVKDKWVLVFRYLPEQLSPERRQYFSRFSGLRYKAMVAREKGARGLIVVSGPLSQVKEQLVAFEAGNAIGTMSLGALSISDGLAQSWLQMAGKDLKGLQTQLDQGEWAQGFEIPGLKLAATVDIRQEKKTSRNVLAKLPSNRSGAAAHQLMIGAHLDHLGYGEGQSSLAGGNEKGQIHPGADDNASGSAGVLELAEYFAAQRKQGAELKQDLLFALWSGEELGLLGSNHYVETLSKEQLGRFSSYLNMDMVGRLDQALVIQGTGSSSLWPELLERANLSLGLPVVTQQTSYLPTDATSFYLKGIPVLSAFTGAHGEYHTPRDTPEKINYPGTEKVVQLLAKMAAEISRKDLKPDFISMKKPEGQENRGGLRVYLGSIPDYASGDVKGLKLAGVSAGGPAEKAGLMAGDIIVSLGGRKIENIYDYTYAIDTLKVGEATAVVIVRKGQTLTLTLIPGSRN